MKTIYLLTALCISVPSYSSQPLHESGDVLHEKPGELTLHNFHRDEARHWPQGAVTHDQTQKENKLKMVDTKIAKYEDILKRLEKDDAALKEHYEGYIKLYQTLRTKVEHNPSIDVHHEIALIVRQHNLYSDTGY
jgi:hypothetical protein